MRNKMLHAISFTYAKAIMALLLALMIIVSYTPLAVYSSQSTEAVYYVATTGDDNNPGTIHAPWRTIQKAASSVVGGNTVFVRGGVYEEFVTIRSSGSKPQGYITFQAYPGEIPVIDGTNLNLGNGNNSLIHLMNANYVIIDGFELRNLFSSSEKEYPAGIRAQGGGSQIHILNNNVHHIGNHSSEGNAHGIHIYGDSLSPMTGIEINGNQVHHLILGSSESLTVSGNVDGFSVKRNLIHDNNNIGIDIAGHYDTCSFPCTDQARNGIVADNTVYNIDASTNPAYGSGSNSAGGIYADGAADIMIERNQVYGSDFGIEIASENEGKTTERITVRNNYIHDNDGAGIIMGGSDTDNGGASDNLIHNNTLINNDRLQQGYGEITLQEHNVNNQIVNNVIMAGSKKRFIQKLTTTGGGNVIDYNLYFHLEGADSRSWRWDGKSFDNWEAYKSYTGHDRNSIVADPRLGDARTGAIYPLEGSPVIDRGTSFVSASTDYYGGPRNQGDQMDIGAVEYGNAISTAVQVPASTPTPAPTSTPVLSPTASSESKPASPTSTAAPTVPPAGTTEISGNTEEWNSVPDLATGESNVKSIKTKLEDELLHIRITGYLLSDKGQLYLNADRSGTTGFQAPYWDKAGADFLVEDGILYAYSGSGHTDWKWTEKKSYKRLGTFSVTSTAVEVAIPLEDLGLASGASLELGYVWKDHHEHKLPSAKRLALVDGNMSASNPTSTTPVMKVDGQIDEWKDREYSDQGSNPKGLKLSHDDRHLYFMTEGTDLDSKTQYYLNTDDDPETGYQTSAWTDSGADVLIESGRMYQYTGSGKNWSWKLMANLKSSSQYVASDKVIEAALPLADLGLEPGDSLRIGVLLNDDKTTKLPKSGDMIVYAIPQ